jgi:hypothetical protein
MNENVYTAPPIIDRLQTRALIIGLVGLALCVAGAFVNPAQFFRSYLMGYMLWIGTALGCLAIVMLQYLTAGDWGLVIRRVLESATRTLPLMALLFLPLLLGLRELYVWARPDSVAGPAVLQHKRAYLNVPFFLIRAVLYFAVWLALTYFLNKWSREQDRVADPRWLARLRRLSGPGIVLYGLTVTFAAVDWIMSLDPEWFSTIFGVIFMGGQALTAMSFVIVIAALLAERAPMSGAILPGHFLDLGKMLLAFLMFWAYVMFSQFLVIWSGNLADEIPWYLHRLRGGWQWVGVLLIVLSFGLPFLLLLSRFLKQSGLMLALVAGLVFFMRVVDLFWITEPNFYPGRFHLHWMDVVMPIGLGGIWLAVFAWQLKTRPLLPLHDPNLEEVLSHGRE